MPAQELEDAVKIYLHQGAKPEDIKEYLVSQGWQEQAVDEVLASHQKQPSIWQMLPTYKYYKELDAKTASLPPKKILAISIILVFLVLLIIFSNYIFMKIFSFQEANTRDKERDIVYQQLETALNNYYRTNGFYPSTLSALMPEYISRNPTDPKTGEPYGYFTKNLGAGYALCFYFETKPATGGCLNTEILTPQELGIPEEAYSEIE